MRRRVRRRTSPSTRPHATTPACDTRTHSRIDFPPALGPGPIACRAERSAAHSCIHYSAAHTVQRTMPARPAQRVAHISHLTTLSHHAGRSQGGLSLSKPRQSRRGRASSGSAMNENENKNAPAGASSSAYGTAPRESELHNTNTHTQGATQTARRQANAVRACTLLYILTGGPHLGNKVVQPGACPEEGGGGIWCTVAAARPRIITRDLGRRCAGLGLL